MKKITDETFDDLIAISKENVLVACTASWCQPCKKQKPILEQFEQAKADEIECFQMDIDDSSENALTYNVNSIPAFLWFHKGKLVNKDFGLKTMAALELCLDKAKENAKLLP